MSFDEQPDGDPHGECAAEIHRLSGALKASLKQAFADNARMAKMEGTLRVISRVAKMESHDEAGLIPMVEDALNEVKP